MPVTRSMVLVMLAGSAAALVACKSEKRDEPVKAAPTAACEPAQAAEPAADAAAPAPSATAASVEDFSTAEDYTAKPLTRINLASGLVIEDLKVGEGDAALPRAIVTFHYRAKIDGDREFHSTLTREGWPKPESQPLNKLVRGLNEGMIGMQKGGRRRLSVPPHLARGIVGLKDVDGTTLIPPDATLVYVVDVLEIQQPVLTEPPAAGAQPQPAPAPTGPGAGKP